MPCTSSSLEGAGFEYEVNEGDELPSMPPEGSEGDKDPFNLDGL